MGIENLIEEGIGAFAADKALEAVDPNAGFLAKATAALAGGEGVNLLKGALGGDGQPAAEQATDDTQATQADYSDDSQNS